MGLFLSGLFALGSIYIIPGAGQWLLDRIIIPIEIFLTAMLAHSLLVFAEFVLLAINQTKAKLADQQITNSFRLWRVAVIGLSFSIGILILHQYYSDHFRHYRLTLQELKSDQDIFFNKDQAGLIANQKSSGSDQLILYLSETPMYLYFSNGGLEHGAYYYPAVGSSIEDRMSFTKKLESVTYLVQRNPVFAFQKIREVGIVLDQDSTLIINSISGQSLSSFEVLIKNSGDEAEFLVEWISSIGEVGARSIVNENSSRWISFEQNELMADRILFSVGNDQDILIKGIRFTGLSETFWPWEEGVIFILNKSGTDLQRFEISEAVLTGGLDIEINVVDDRGYTVLAEVVK